MQQRKKVVLSEETDTEDVQSQRAEENVWT
jgi:hypothetical protein